MAKGERLTHVGLDERQKEFILIRSTLVHLQDYVQNTIRIQVETSCREKKMKQEIGNKQTKKTKTNQKIVSNTDYQKCRRYCWIWYQWELFLFYYFYGMNAKKQLVTSRKSAFLNFLTIVLFFSYVCQTRWNNSSLFICMHLFMFYNGFNLSQATQQWWQ